MAEIEIKSGVSIPFYGGAPYGDMMEVTGPPVLTVIEPPYREFLDTDARTVMVVVHPHHYNFIKNPAFRRGLEGWTTEYIGDASGFGESVQTGATEDSWVGKAITVNGSWIIRPEQDGHYVYVGPTNDIDQLDWYEPGRASAEWTFSCYVKGGEPWSSGPVDVPARVRLIMDAYLPSDGTVAKSPPLYADATPVADPLTAPYGDAVVVDPDKNVWLRNDPPFYRSLGAPPTNTNPANIVNGSSALPDLLLASDGMMWEKIPGATSFPWYEEYPELPILVKDALASGPATKYVFDSFGQYWLRHPGSPTTSTDTYNDPYSNIYEFTAETNGPYYVKVFPQSEESPATYRPDKTLMPPYLLDTDGNLWQLASPLADDGLPQYVKYLTKPVAVTNDPSVTAPGADLIIVNNPTLSSHGQVWKLLGPPYYTRSEESGTEYESAVGPWFEVPNDGRWHRIMVRTSAYDDEDRGKVSFLGCTWIDCQIEVQNCKNLLVSSAMLDPNERVVAQYFDGSMTEGDDNDDFIWAEADRATNAPLADQSISLYYYDRMSRVRWLWDALQYVVPVDRPYQIFFDSLERPYVPPSREQIATTPEHEMTL